MFQFDRIRALQDELTAAGLETATVHSAGPNPSTEISFEGDELEDSLLFSVLIVENEIRSVARDLFDSGFYNLAVAESFKAVDKFIAKKAKLPKQSGTSMMESVFSPNSPKLHWSERTTASEEDEQKGYQRLFAGAMLGIRNPTTHENDWINQANTALELIVFAQHLLRKAKSAMTPT